MRHFFFPVTVLSVLTFSPSWAEACEKKCAPGACDEAILPCKFLTAVQSCSVEWKNNTKYKEAVRGTPRFGVLVAQPPPSKAIPGNIDFINKNFSSLYSSLNTCMSRIEGKKWSAVSEKSWGERFAETKMGTWLENAGTKIGQAAAKIKDAVLQKAHTLFKSLSEDKQKKLREFVDWKVRRKLNDLAAAYSVEKRMEKIVGKLIEVSVLGEFIKDTVRMGLKALFARLLPISTKVSLALRICGWLFGVIEAACAAIGPPFGAIGCPALCPVVTEGLIEALQKRLEKYLTDKLSGWVADKIATGVVKVWVASLPEANKKDLTKLGDWLVQKIDEKVLTVVINWMDAP